jgi:hypothetical protein
MHKLGSFGSQCYIYLKLNYTRAVRKVHKLVAVRRCYAVMPPSA